MKPINLRPITGHVIVEDSNRSPVPHGKGLAVVHPHTREVFMMSRSQLAQAQSWAANQSRNGRGRMIRRGGLQ